MVRTLILATLIATTLSTSAMAQPRYWRHHMGWRRCHWVWHGRRHVMVCYRR